MPKPEESIGFLIGEVSRLLRGNFNRRARDLGLSQAQWRVLAHLARREGVNQVTLADSLEIQPITLARQIDRLQEAGLVERRADPADRRAFRLYLTAAAEPVLEQVWALGAETRADALAGVSPEMRHVLTETLQHIKANLLAAEGCPPADCDSKEKKEATR